MSQYPSGYPPGYPSSNSGTQNPTPYPTPQMTNSMGLGQNQQMGMNMNTMGGNVGMNMNTMTNSMGMGQNQQMGMNVNMGTNVGMNMGNSMGMPNMNMSVNGNQLGMSTNMGIPNQNMGMPNASINIGMTNLPQNLPPPQIPTMTTQFTQPQVNPGYPMNQQTLQRTVSVGPAFTSPRLNVQMQPTMTVVQQPQPTMTVVQHVQPQQTMTVVQQVPTVTVVNPSPMVTQTITQSPGAIPGTIKITKTTTHQPPPQPQVIERVIHKVIERQEPTLPPKTMTITIEDFRTVNNEYTEYDVKVVSDLPQHGIEGYPILVSKRYNDFLELHTAIVELLGADARFLPEFPPKVWFGKLDPVLVVQRKEQFQHLMTFISKEPKLRVSNTIDHFFGISHTRHSIKTQFHAD